MFNFFKFKNKEEYIATVAEAIKASLEKINNLIDKKAEVKREWWERCYLRYEEELSETEKNVKTQKNRIDILEVKIDTILKILCIEK